jgi:chromosome partitioning protein
VPLDVPDHYTVAEPSVTAPHPDATEASVFTSTLAALPAGYDFVVIDTPSGENHLSLLAHALADTLITPINDSFVDLDVIGTMAPSSDFKPRRSRYSEMVANAGERRSLVSSNPTDWVVVRNRLPRLMSRNQRQVAEMLEVMAPELGFRTARGLSDRVIYREFFPVGLTAFDPLDENRLGLKANLAHVMARSEVRELMQDIGVLPSDEKLDFESRVNLIVSELRLPPVTLLGPPLQTKSPA